MAVIEGNNGNNNLQGFSGQHFAIDPVTGLLVLYPNGDDTIRGFGGNDTIDGNGGDDDIYSGSGNDLVRGGDGNDYVFGATGADTIYGNNGNDRLFSGTANDYVRGGNGNDFINGWRGNDRLYGDSGNDTINGSYDDDRVYGGSGNDILNGGSGDDTLVGGGGNDTLTGADASVVTGDGDIDVLTSSSTLDQDVFVLGNGTNIFYDGAGLDYAHITDFDRFGSLHDTIRLTGSSSDYTLNNGVIGGVNGALIGKNNGSGEIIAVLEGIDANTISLNSNLFDYV